MQVGLNQEFLGTKISERSGTNIRRPLLQAALDKC
jgi:hypothetical protein